MISGAPLSIGPVLEILTAKNEPSMTSVKSVQGKTKGEEASEAIQTLASDTQEALLAFDAGEVFSRIFKDLMVILLQPGIGGLEYIVMDTPEAMSIAVDSPTQIVANEKMCLLYEVE
ncbi:hypothetical protein K438DRAFT_1779471 [Mycena galopus ATCC 62051]|nr:hypothetical protein K438DRAFT_1779471 [Mycena galopus ATCC 62051]